MSSFIAWIKNNKLATFLLIVIAFFLARQSSPVIPLGLSQKTVSMNTAIGGVPMMAEMVADEGRGILPPEPEPDIPPSDSANRLIITDTNLSLLVDDVAASIDRISGAAQSFGGFLVNSSLDQPEGAASGSITVRVPSDQLPAALDAFRSFSVRVVSENVTGRDVTDQYEDLDARLEVLNNTKTKFESILDQASEIQDLLQVQRELTNLQAQIDYLVGRQQYLEQSASLSKITVYLSTDELALPYTPDEVWRPTAIFKQAVRSLISSARSFVNALIWLAVYSVVLIPVIIIFFLVKKLIRPKQPSS